MTRMHIVLLLLVTTMPMVKCHDSYDRSLESACAQMGGQMKKRESAGAVIGDTCSLKFQVATRDDDDARDFCELYAPWRLQKAERTMDGEVDFTTCHVEATLTCAKEWHQMFGYCFKMPNKYRLYNLEEAKTACKDAQFDAVVAVLHHKYIAGVWKRFFHDISQIWVNATESWDQYVQKTNTIDGEALALAFTGKHFDFAVPANSLIRIKPTTRLQALCQYKPKISNAEINYLGRRYSEIYYPSVTVEQGILVRSASSYTSSVNNMDVCEKTLKPYMYKPMGPFVPEPDPLFLVGQTNLPLIYLTRSGAEARLDPSKQIDEECQPVTSRFSIKVPGLTVGDVVIKQFTDSMPCDNMKSAGITHFNQNAKLSVISESRSLPIWCKLGQTAKFTYTTPKGYTAFQRENGDVVAHKLYSEKMNYQKAYEKCRDDEAFLSGINSLKEANALGELVNQAKEKNLQYWLGGIRKKQCQDKHFEEGTTGNCSRNNVIEWQDGVAQTFYDDWWRSALELEGYPDFRNPSSTPKNPQFCLTYVHGTPYWADPDKTGFLDDIHCEKHKIGAFCEKKVPILKTEIYE